MKMNVLLFPINYTGYISLFPDQFGIFFPSSSLSDPLISIVFIYSFVIVLLKVAVKATSHYTFYIKKIGLQIYDKEIRIKN